MNARTIVLSSVLAVSLGACSTQIQHGLDEREANEIVTALGERGYAARKVPEKGKKPTWAIEVPEEKATEALKVLTELKLPRPARATTRAVIQSSGLIETPAAERLKQLEAQEGDIEEGLEGMDGVSTASVELVVPPPARPGMPAVPSKASVLLRAHPEAVERLTQQRGELKALVAASVDGLKPEDVVLVVDVVQLAPPPPVTAAGPDLRPLVVAMGGALSVVALLLMVVVVMLRRARRGPVVPTVELASGAPAPRESQSLVLREAPARPVAGAQVQRRPA